MFEILLFLFVVILMSYLPYIQNLALVYNYSTLPYKKVFISGYVTRKGFVYYEFDEEKNGEHIPYSKIMPSTIKQSLFGFKWLDRKEHYIFYEKDMALSPDVINSRLLNKYCLLKERRKELRQKLGAL